MIAYVVYSYLSEQSQHKLSFLATHATPTPECKFKYLKIHSLHVVVGVCQQSQVNLMLNHCSRWID